MLPQTVVDSNAGECTADDEDNETDEGDQVIETEAAKCAARKGGSTDEANSNDDYTQQRRVLGLAIIFNNNNNKGYERA